MGALVLAVRAPLRRRARTLIGLVLLGGLGAGITLACLAGARRTATSFDRFEEASRQGDIEIGFEEDLPFAERLDLVDRVQALPQVARSTGGSWLMHTVPGLPPDALITIAALDERFGHEMQVPQVLDGRLPDPDRLDEVVLNQLAAEDLGLGVGDELELESVPADQLEAFFTNQPFEGARQTFTITGVVRYPDDLESYEGSGMAFLTPAYWEAHARETAFFGPAINVEVFPGQREEFVAAASEFLPPSAIVAVEDDADVSVGEATRVQATALLLFAAVAGVATLVFLTLGYSRQVLAGEDDTSALEAIGMSRRQRWLVMAAPVVFGGVAAAVVAGVVAVALSPLFPFGIAGDAEPDPGLDVDPLVVVGGAVVVGLVLALAAGAVALVGLHRRPDARPRRESTLPLPLVPALGVGMAIRPGRGRRAVPTRSALATATVGIALFVATLSFGQSLNQLVRDPVRYGWNVDLITGTSDDPDTYDDVAPQIEADGRIGDWAVASVVELTARDRSLWVMGLEAVEGDIGPVIIDGRPPTGPGEVALGRETLDDLDASVGDRLAMAPVDGGEAVEVEIVGTSVLPGGDHDFPGGLGEGGVMTLDGLAAIADAPRNVYLARAAPGVDAERLVLDYRADRPGIYGPRPGPEIDNLYEASRVIPAVVLSVGVLGFIALAHALVMTVRRRRRDLALLGSLGMRPRELTGIVLVQGAVIAGLALLIGIPLGLVLVTPAWGAAAASLGVADDVAGLQPLDLAVLIVSVIGATLVLAALPSRSAARTRPAIVLRSE